MDFLSEFWEKVLKLYYYFIITLFIFSGSCSPVHAAENGYSYLHSSATDLSGLPASFCGKTFARSTTCAWIVLFLERDSKFSKRGRIAPCLVGQFCPSQIQNLSPILKFTSQYCTHKMNFILPRTFFWSAKIRS